MLLGTGPAALPRHVLLATALGCLGFAAVLYFALSLPSPTVFQMFVFRVTLALAAAAIGALLPGLLHVESTNAVVALRASGALALFLLVYIVNPPELAARLQKEAPSGANSQVGPPESTQPAPRPTSRDHVANLTRETPITESNCVAIIRSVGLRLETAADGNARSFLPMLANNGVRTKGDLDDALSDKKAFNTARALLLAQTGADFTNRNHSGLFFANYVAFLHSQNTSNEAVAQMRASIRNLHATPPN